MELQERTEQHLHLRLTYQLMEAAAAIKGMSQPLQLLRGVVEVEAVELGLLVPHQQTQEVCQPLRRALMGFLVKEQEGTYQVTLEESLSTVVEAEEATIAQLPPLVEAPYLEAVEAEQAGL